MRKHIVLAVAFVCALITSGAANLTWAGCAHCGGPGVAQYDAGCADCGACGAPCGHCRHCGQHLLAVPVKAVKWVLRTLGGGCPCGGCDPEVYWGPFCCEQNQCDRCGNHIGGMPMRSYSGYADGGMSYAPMEAAPRAGCNCHRGSVSQASPTAVRSYAPRPASDDGYAAYPGEVRRAPASNHSGGRNVQASYVADPRYSAAKRAAAATPRYAPAPSEGPRLALPSANVVLPPGASRDMFQPRLISVTDRVVKPAAASSDVPLNAQRAEPEIER